MDNKIVIIFLHLPSFVMPCYYPPSAVGFFTGLHVGVSPLLVVNKITSNPELSKLLNIDLEHRAVARGLSSIYYI